MKRMILAASALTLLAGTSISALAAEDPNKAVWGGGDPKTSAYSGVYVPHLIKVMADALIKIPNVSREAKLTANKKDLDAKLASVKRQLADPKLTATKRAKLEACPERPRRGPI